MHRCFNLPRASFATFVPTAAATRARLSSSSSPRTCSAWEATGLITGVYHVLMGHIAPLDGVGPADLTIDALVQRVKAGDVHEVILATNPTIEGDTTALHITSLLADTGVTVTRLARGIAPGSQIEFANRAMLEEAFRGRRNA